MECMILAKLGWGSKVRLEECPSLTYNWLINSGEALRL